MDGVEDVVEAAEALGHELVHMVHQEVAQLLARVARPYVPHRPSAPVAAAAPPTSHIVKAEDHASRQKDAERREGLALQEHGQAILIRYTKTKPTSPSSASTHC
jgi:hypothetical protein